METQDTISIIYYGICNKQAGCRCHECGHATSYFSTCYQASSVVDGDHSLSTKRPTPDNWASRRNFALGPLIPPSQLITLYGPKLIFSLWSHLTAVLASWKTPGAWYCFLRYTMCLCFSSFRARWLSILHLPVNATAWISSPATSDDHKSVYLIYTVYCFIYLFRYLMLIIANKIENRTIVHTLNTMKWFDYYLR